VIELYLKSRLLADTTLKNAINSQIYPVVASADAVLPYLVYARVSGVGDYDHGGTSGLRTVETEVRAWADTYDSARTLTDHVRRVMDGHRDAIGAGPFRMVRVSDGEDFYVKDLDAFGTTVIVSMRYDEGAVTPT